VRLSIRLSVHAHISETTFLTFIGHVTYGSDSVSFGGVAIRYVVIPVLLMTPCLCIHVVVTNMAGNLRSMVDRPMQIDSTGVNTGSGQSVILTVNTRQQTTSRF